MGMQSDGRLTLTVAETAKLLGLSRAATFQACHTGQLPHLRIGKRLLICKAALERLIDEAGKVEQPTTKQE